MASQNAPLNHSDEPQKQETYKDQLDRAAAETRANEAAAAEKPNPVVEKITKYVPAAAKVLGVQDRKSESPENKETSVPGPPHRPDHDTHIEEFVRDQHRSKRGHALLSEGQE